MIILITYIPPLGVTRTAWKAGKIMNSLLIFAEIFKSMLKRLICQIYIK